MGENVGALDGLREETEDVVDYQDGLGCAGGAGGVYGGEFLVMMGSGGCQLVLTGLHASQVNIFALGLIAFADDGGDTVELVSAAVVSTKKCFN